MQPLRESVRPPLRTTCPGIVEEARGVPMTYEVNGTQFVAVAAGGHETVTKIDNTLVVFKLP